MLLKVKDLNVNYGVIHAIKNVSFEVEEGEIVALIGANGAGKTSTLHAISSLISSKSGEIIFDGKDISKMPARVKCAVLGWRTMKECFDKNKDSAPGTNPECCPSH